MCGLDGTNDSFVLGIFSNLYVSTVSTKNVLEAREVPFYSN